LFLLRLAFACAPTRARGGGGGGGKKKLDDSSRLDVVEISRVSDMLPSLFPFCSG